MRSSRQIYFLAILALLLASACDDEGGSTDRFDQTWNLDTSGVVFSNAALGISVSGMEEYGQNIQYADDGSLELDAEAVVTIDGQGARDVEVVAFFDNVASGARRTLFTLDFQTNEERLFHHDPVDNAIVFGDLDGGVFVFGEPDGTYGVVTALFDQPVDAAQVEIAETGYEAWQLLQDYNQFTETSNHSLVLAYALAQGRVPETRVQGPSCVLPDCDPTAAPAATSTPVCQTFKALCDCIACQAVGKGDNCDLCVAP